MKSRPRRIISVDKTGFLPHDRAATPRLACSFPIWKSTNMIDFWRRNGGGASTRITVCADVGVCANDCIPRRLHTPAKISSTPQENNLLRKNYGAGCSPHFQTPYENRSLVDFQSAAAHWDSDYLCHGIRDIGSDLMQQAYSAFSKQGMSTEGVVLPLRAHSLFENRPMTNCKKQICRPTATHPPGPLIPSSKNRPIIVFHRGNEKWLEYPPEKYTGPPVTSYKTSYYWLQY